MFGPMGMQALLPYLLQMMQQGQGGVAASIAGSHGQARGERARKARRRIRRVLARSQTTFRTARPSQLRKVFQSVRRRGSGVITRYIESATYD